MTTSETFIFGFFVIITVIVFATLPSYIRRDRNVRNSNSDSANNSLNGEDV